MLGGWWHGPRGTVGYVIVNAGFDFDHASQFVVAWAGFAGVAEAAGKEPAGALVVDTVGMVPVDVGMDLGEGTEIDSCILHSGQAPAASGSSRRSGLAGVGGSGYSSLVPKRCRLPVAQGGKI